MKNKLRIPVILEYFYHEHILINFLNNPPVKVLDDIKNNWLIIDKFWNENPDLRFGQLLCNLRFIPTLDIENHIWNIEEDRWLIENDYCNIEDISFWRVNYYKNGKKRKTTEFKLLRDLDIDHIKNIIEFFKKDNNLNKINKQYLDYFNKRIENGK